MRDLAAVCGSSLWQRRLWRAMIARCRWYRPHALDCQPQGRERMIRLATATTILAAMVVSANAQVARLELHPVLSVTLKDSDFLGGRKDGQQVTIAGELRIPKAGNEKLPAVVLLHG